MYTYQDLLKRGNDEFRRIEFIKAAIQEHINSPEYRIAEKANAYYRHANPDIANFEKIIYDFMGIAHKDTISTNTKLANAYYPLIIDMGTSHLLANGIAFEDTDLKEQLGSNFDKVIKDIFTDCRNCGVSYGYYNGNAKKLIHFKYTEFKALLDEESGMICAGIRFFRIDAEKPLMVTLYERDGYTEYIQPQGEEMRVRNAKQRYDGIVYSNAIEGNYSIDADEKSILPIYPMYNILKQSAIAGNINILFAIDMIDSGLINNLHEADMIYWILQGYGGMDAVDDQNFLVHLLKNHVAHTDNEGQTITPHQINVQYSANEAGAVRLKRMLFDNMRGVMAEVLSAGNLTATAISSAYSAQRLNSGLLEDEVREFLQGIFRIMGEDENAKISFSYYETINQSEAIQNVLASAQYLGEKVPTRLLASLNGVIDDLDSIEEEKAENEMAQFGMMGGETSEEEEPEGSTDAEEAEMADKYMSEFGDEVIAMLESLLKDEEEK